FEEGNITSIPVPSSNYTFNGSNQIALAKQNISAVTVTSLSGLTYVVGTDYSVDNVNGIINRITTGGIPAAATVKVAYSYAEIVEAIASGGSAPTAPSN